MWRRFSLLVLCCAVSGLDALEAEPSRETMLVTEAAEVDGPVQGAPHAAKAQDSPRGGEQQSPGRDAPELRAESPTAEPLEEELANQENVMSQLLGDYDKVKTVSSGSDCVCRCIVRPIKRSDCSRNQDSDLASQHSYSVETVTKGTDCKKCVCMAPPSAVNPCEGEYRFKKLQEASKDDIKLATIIDLLEGSLYGMDLLKLHSVTTKLLSRVDNMEEALARNFTERAREKERAKERAKEKEKVKKAQQKKKKKNNEGQLKKNHQHDGLEQQQQPTRNKTATQNPIKEKTEPKQPNKDKNSMVVRGVTFYKAEGESHQEEEEEEKGRGKNTGQTAISSLDLLDIETLRTFPKKSPASSTTVGTQLEPTQQPTAPPTTTQQTTTTARPVPTTTITPTTQLTSNVPPTTPQPTTPPPTTPQPTTPQPTTPQPTTPPPTTPQPTTPQPTTTKLTTTSQQTTAKPVPTTIQPTTELTTNVPPTTPPPTTPQPTTTKLTTTTQLTTIQPSDTGTGPPIEAPPTAESRPGSKSRLSWTESPADQPKTTKKPVVCKDTLASISEPVQQNSYGFSDGAWMRDGRGHGNVIYLTNGHYGNNLIEFRDMGSFKSGQPSNSYKLPYSFTGTGHTVFNGAFYYNRAFSRDVIRYDLRHRYVAAWTTLHDAILEEQAHRTQSEVQFAIDESGLWLLYPALDTEGFHQEVILLIQLHPRDLQPIQSFRTGLRRGRYGNSFLVCGVLYAVNSMEHHYANVTYAFDTHTLTHTVPSLAFTNVHSHTSQLAYCPVDKKLYAWDNGHQMTYDVIFAY